MQFEILPASEVSLPEQARVANVAFANYVGGWADMDATSLARFLLLQGTDLFYSRFIRSADTLLGFGYINRTGDILRLSGMAVVPEARGTGAAGQLLTHLFEDAKLRGDAAMMLEVIEQNPRAVTFYRRHGFREISHLLGWRRQAAPGSGAVDEVEEVSILGALRSPLLRDYPALPWQISRHAIAKAEKTTAFRQGDACIVIAEAGPATLRVHGLLSAAENWHGLRVALTGVIARFPDREFVASAIWPEEFGREVFAPLGFAREPLSQFLMRLYF